MYFKVVPLIAFLVFQIIEIEEDGKMTILVQVADIFKHHFLEYFYWLMRNSFGIEVSIF